MQVDLEVPCKGKYLAKFGFLGLTLRRKGLGKGLRQKFLVYGKGGLAKGSMKKQSGKWWEKQIQSDSFPGILENCAVIAKGREF